MSEMLGNHYFQLKNYLLAKQSYEKELLRGHPGNKTFKRLIICYTQTNKISEAKKLFLQLIEKDINIILKTDVDEEFCPCGELITQIENDVIKYENDFEKNCALGILWLFCDFNKSLKYFQLANSEVPSDITVQKILKLIKCNSNQNYHKQT